MKTAYCLKSPSHRLFRRLIEVQGKSDEVIDASLQLVHIEDPKELRLLRRYTGVFCLIDGSQAVIKLK